MNRRVLLLSAAGSVSLLPGLALAQSSDPNAATMSPDAMSGMGSTATTTGMAMEKSEAERMAAMSMMLSLRSSELALTRASNPRVKEFAQLEAEEQAVFLALMHGGRMPEMPVDQAMQAKLQPLEGAGDAAAFDRTYVQMQVEGHQMLLQQVSDVARTSRNPVNAAVATAGIPAIKTHLVMLGQLQQG